jgi:hypothetical protein
MNCGDGAHPNPILRKRGEGRGGALLCLTLILLFSDAIIL